VLFGQTKTAHAALIHAVEQTDVLSSKERRATDDRYVLGNWTLDTGLEKIRTTTMAWVLTINALAKNLNKSQSMIHRNILTKHR
jgi:hypothetical protein